MNILFDIIGLVGVACYVYAFVGLQTLGWEAHSYRYLLCNFVGAVLTLISLIFAFNLASFVSQIIWLLISLSSLWKVQKTSIAYTNPKVDSLGDDSDKRLYPVLISPKGFSMSHCENTQTHRYHYTHHYHHQSLRHSNGDDKSHKRIA